MTIPNTRSWSTLAHFGKMDSIRFLMNADPSTWCWMACFPRFVCWECHVSLRTCGMISHFLFIWVKLDGGFAILCQVRAKTTKALAIKALWINIAMSQRRELHWKHSNWCIRCFGQGSLKYPFWVEDQTVQIYRHFCGISLIVVHCLSW